jgi:hypothetical protein
MYKQTPVDDLLDRNNKYRLCQTEYSVMYVSLHTQREPIPVAARSKAWVCGRSLTRIVGSNQVPPERSYGALRCYSDDEKSE